jgi:hypothetical protein
VRRYPVPSISWISKYGDKSKVHFRWEFDDKDTVCGWSIGEGDVDLTPNREITCQKCPRIIHADYKKRAYKKRFVFRNKQK